jgi:intracellular multiplication protein IcmG
MTDTHGTDPENPHPEAEASEFEQAPAAETWHGDAPPVDDFGDAASSDTATVSEETNVPAATGDGEGQKRSMLMPAMAVMGVILIVGAGLYCQFGVTHVTEEPPMSMQTPQIKMQTASSMPAVPEPAEPIAPKTAMAVPTPGDASAVPSPASTVPDSAPVVPAVTPTSALPTVTPTVPSQQAMPAAPPSDSSADARIAALTARVEDLQKSLSQANVQLVQVSEKLSTQPQGQPPAATAQIEDRLNKVEQQVLQMEHGAAPASSMPTSAATPEMAMGEEPAVKPATHHHTASSTHHKTTHHKTAKATSHPSSKPAAKTWVLRAAMPDEAWVAADTTTAEVRPVHIGDTLPGIGRVTAIRQDGNVWSVVGSGGIIR